MSERKEKITFLIESIFNQELAEGLEAFQLLIETDSQEDAQVLSALFDTALRQTKKKLTEKLDSLDDEDINSLYNHFNSRVYVLLRDISKIVTEVTHGDMREYENTLLLASMSPSNSSVN